MFVIGFYLMKKYAKKGPVPEQDTTPFDGHVQLSTEGAQS
jgi:cytochrome d ubiquinol oxidase subunit I